MEKTSSLSRKKVLFLITKSNWGGAQRYVYDLTTNLDHNQFEPVVALGGDGILIEMLHNAGIRTIALGELKNSTGLKAAWAAGREIYHIIKHEQPEILHLNSSVAGLIGTIAGRLAGIPSIIFTAHGWAFNEDRKPVQRLGIKAMHWLTVLLSHRTIAVSRAIVAQLNWPGAERRMKVVNPGRSIGVMYGRAEARAKICGFYPELAAYNEDVWLVSIAELHPIKRHLVLLEAFSTLLRTQPTARLLLIGEGSERATLTDYIQTNQLEQSVFLTGNITEAARFLKAFDLFLLASKSESYGYVLHEAGLAGVPVIATNVGGIPDIITHKQTGLLLPPDNAAILHDAMVYLLTNPTKKAALAAALEADLRGRTVERMVRQTVALY